MDEAVETIAVVEGERPLIALALERPTAGGPETTIPWWGPADPAFDCPYCLDPAHGVRVIGMLWFPEVLREVERSLRTLWLLDGDSQAEEQAEG